MSERGDVLERGVGDQRFSEQCTVGAGPIIEVILLGKATPGVVVIIVLALETAGTELVGNIALGDGRSDRGGGAACGVAVVAGDPLTEQGAGGRALIGQTLGFVEIVGWRSGVGVLLEVDERLVGSG